MSTKRESQETGVTGLTFTNDSIHWGQTWTASASYKIDKISPWISKLATKTGNVYLKVWTTDASEDPLTVLTTVTVNYTAIPDYPDEDYVDFTLTDVVNVEKDTIYAFTLSRTADGNAYWAETTSDVFADGDRLSSADGSSGSWSHSATRDTRFQIWGDPPQPVEKTYSKTLIAIGNSEVWYESSAGTMAELAAANADINVGNPLTACEALQKIFIANGTNLKVIDFKNTKLTHSALTTAHAKGDTLTQATSTATMVVDHTNTAKTLTYGYVTSGVFDTTNSVTGSGSGTAFTPTAVTASPHWYDWTVYPGGASGTMPSQANIVCLYNGRLILAGDKYYPHQWYMSRVINPWDWLYVVNDPLSPIRGGSADAGEIGDIIKALIPYSDDYLIIGCANSLRLLRGDPMSGGSINLLTDETGIYGARAWCFDDTNTLYFFGKNGLYTIPGGGVQPPSNISQAALPNWIKDWALNEANHRIVLSFDSIRRGILISKTALTDGTNSNYYYDLKIGGFYPESYPTACGIFSAYDYDSTNSTYKKHLFGGNDGYIRYFLDSAKDDDTGTTDTAISSYLVYPIIQMAEEDDKEGKLISLTFVVGGGASGGSFGDSDGFTYSLYKGDDAETVLEDIKDGATAFATDSFSTTGRQNRIRTRVRGRWLGLKISNSTATETWAINLVSGEIKPAGRIKG